MIVEAAFLKVSILPYFPIEIILSRFSSFFLQCFFPQPCMKNVALIFMASAAPSGVSDDVIFSFLYPKSMVELVQNLYVPNP